MNSMNARQCMRAVHAQQRGFTLVEVVVALALVAMIAAALLSSLRFGQRSYEKVLRNGSASWDVFASQRLIRNLVESAYPQEADQGGVASQFGIDGGTDDIAMTAPAPMALGGGGFHRYGLDLRARDGSNDLVVSWNSDVAADARTVSVSASAEEVLVEDVASVEWNYMPAGWRDGSDEHNQQWVDSWHDKQHLPAMVRLKLKFRVGDTRTWPDLVMTPRITDDANCVFDVVAQNCRGGS